MLHKMKSGQANELLMQIDIICNVNSSLPSKVHYNLSKNKERLSYALEHTREEVQSLLKDLGGKIVQREGKNVLEFETPENEKKYYEGFNKVMAKEISVELYGLSEQDISEVGMPSQLKCNEFYNFIVPKMKVAK